MFRNVTVPNVSWKEECRTVNQTLPPRQKTIYVEQNVTKSQRICNKVYKEETFNYTMPKYEVIKTNRSEKVGQGGVSFKKIQGWEVEDTISGSICGGRVQTSAGDEKVLSHIPQCRCTPPMSLNVGANDETIVTMTLQISLYQRNPIWRFYCRY